MEHQFENPFSALRRYGYCPQFDALLEQLTGNLQRKKRNLQMTDLHSIYRPRDSFHVFKITWCTWGTYRGTEFKDFEASWNWNPRREAGSRILWRHQGQFSNSMAHLLMNLIGCVNSVFSENFLLALPLLAFHRYLCSMSHHVVLIPVLAENYGMLFQMLKKLVLQCFWHRIQWKNVLHFATDLQSWLMENSNV